MTDIQNMLFSMQDEDYREFNAKLIPNVDKKTVIGVRVPQIRKIARELPADSAAEFLSGLPHKYYEENMLHAFLTERIRDFDGCVSALEEFLPHIDNWAVCDSLRPKCFAKNKTELLSHIETWLTSGHTYTVRYAVEMLMVHFLDGDFDARFLQTVCDIESNEYYVNMMRAWYFATALAKQYDSALVYIEKRLLDTWTHNKTIRKAIESYRISEGQKAFLRTFYVK